MGAVQLQPIKPGPCGTLGGCHKVGFDAVHVGACHGVRGLAHALDVLLRRRAQQRPVGLGVVVSQRLVDAVPGAARRALGTRVANLRGHFGVAVGMHPRHDALPRVGLRVAPQAGATRGDARVGAGANHFGKHHRCTAHGACAQVDQVVVARDAVDRRVLRHGRDHHAVFQGHRAHAVGREHGRCGGQGGVVLGEPVLIAIEPSLVAQTQVLVADALAACEHRVHELLRFQLVAVALAAHLEPGHSVPGSILNFQGFDAAGFLVGGQHVGDVAGVIAQQLKLAGEFDRIFDRQLGA